jgi:hypothetical protein
MANTNGSEPPFDAEALVARVQRTEHKMDRYVDQLLEVGAGVTRIEVTMGEVLRRVASVESKVTVAGVLHAERKQPHLHSLTEEDFEETDHGEHVRMTKRKFQLWTREQETTAAARAWRKQWKWIRWVVGIVGGGALTLCGEQLAKWLLHHV